MKIRILLLSILFFSYSGLFAETGSRNSCISLGNFRTTSSGSWSNIGIWEEETDCGWAAATKIPDYTDGFITIQTGHNITTSTSVSIDQTTIEAGATLSPSATDVIILKYKPTLLKVLALVEKVRSVNPN